MADSLEIIRTSPNSDSDKDLAHASEIVPVVSITRIDHVPKVSPPTSRNTDFSIANLLRKDSHTETLKRPSSPKVRVTKFTPIQGHRSLQTHPHQHHEDPDGEDGRRTASVTSDTNSNCSTDAEVGEDFDEGAHGDTAFRSRRKQRRLAASDSSHYHVDVGEYEHYLNARQHEASSGNDHCSEVTVASSVAQQILAQHKYLSPEEKANLSSTFSWLTCTRFKPPKLPRSSKKRAGCKRYGRGPRIPFAPHQIAVLESTFSKSQYLSSDCIHRLADTLHLSETRVKIWFQNRRARYRREKEPQIGQAATMQLQQSHASPHQMRNSFRKSQLLLSTVPPLAHGHGGGSGSPTSPKTPSNDAAHENTSPFSSSGGSDLQTELEFQDHQTREAAAAVSSAQHLGSRQHRRMLLPNLLPFQLQQHQRHHQQQLQGFYHELSQQHHSRSFSNGSGSARNADGIHGISNSTSPLLHSALQQEAATLYSAQNLSTHHNNNGSERGSGSSSRGRAGSHSPTGVMSSVVDEYPYPIMPHTHAYRQQQYFQNLLRGSPGSSSGSVPFSSGIGSPVGGTHGHGHGRGVQFPFPPAVKYA